MCACQSRPVAGIDRKRSTRLVALEKQVSIYDVFWLYNTLPMQGGNTEWCTTESVNSPMYTIVTQEV